MHSNVRIIIMIIDCNEAMGVRILCCRRESNDRRGGWRSVTTIPTTLIDTIIFIWCFHTFVLKRLVFIALKGEIERTFVSLFLFSLSSLVWFKTADIYTRIKYLYVHVSDISTLDKHELRKSEKKYFSKFVYVWCLCFNSKPLAWNRRKTSWM